MAAASAAPKQSGIDTFGEIGRHKDKVTALAWSPDGAVLASGSEDETVGLLDLKAGAFRSVTTSYYSKIASLAWAPDGSVLAAVTREGQVHLVDAESASARRPFALERGTFPKLAWMPDGKRLLGFTRSGRVAIWEAATGRRLEAYELKLPAIRYGIASPDVGLLALAGSEGGIAVFDVERRREAGRLGGRGRTFALQWAPGRPLLLAALADGTIRVWNVRQGRQETVLEGHTEPAVALAFSRDFRVLASQDAGGRVRLWRTADWETIGEIEKVAPGGTEAIAFHPTAPLLAATGARNDRVRLWRLDRRRLLAAPPAADVVHYRNAKIVLVGDSGVGKSGLALRLLGRSFAPTESTHGRYVHVMERKQVRLPEGGRETREALLWDLAGQPGYRLVHQLHLDEVAVALVVFDCKSATDPFAGVGHWDRALRAAQLATEGGRHLRKYLVAARVDRGSIAASPERIEEKVAEHGFAGYFETSAREGWGVEALGEAIRRAIPWKSLPRVSSTEGFERIKDFLVGERDAGRVLASLDELYARWLDRRGGKASNEQRQEFQTCVRLLETRDVVRRLGFGDLVLLRPEYLDAYASAVVEAARAAPDGSGRLAQRAILEADFRMSRSERIADAVQERILLMATVEDLLRREIAFRETADHGVDLIFPSQITRENRALPEGRRRRSDFLFEGPVMNVYATLAVRLAQTGLFERWTMWRDGALFVTPEGPGCAITLGEPSEGRGELALFVDGDLPEEIGRRFEAFVETHLGRWVSSEHVHRRRVVACGECGTLVPEDMVERRLARGMSWITCGVCDATVPLAADAEAAAEPTDAGMLQRLADRAREHAAGLTAAAAEMEMPAFVRWAGGERADLAIVFTDVVGSVGLYERLGDDGMDEVLDAHFEAGRRHLKRHEGYEIKTMGDAFMVAFRSPVAAVDFMIDLHGDTGHKAVQVRAAAASGGVRIREGDAFGGVVNYAARIQSLANGPEIWVSQPVKEAFDGVPDTARRRLAWRQHLIEADGRRLKGFTGTHVLWEVADPRSARAAAGGRG